MISHTNPQVVIPELEPPVFNDCFMPRSLQPPKVVYREDAAEQPYLHDCKIGLVATNKTAAIDGNSLKQLHPHPKLRTLDLDGEHVVAFVPSYSKVAVLNRSAVALLDSLRSTPKDRHGAEAAVIDTLAEAGLLVHPRSAPPIDSPEILTAWLHVTNACNLGCTYCYIAKANQQMSVAIGHAAIDAVIRSALTHQYTGVALKYAGGESTLVMDRIVAIHHYAQMSTAQYGLALHAGILSNGTLLDPTMLTTIRTLGLQLMISLDGNDALHNRERPDLRGRGTFNRVQTGIEQALAVGLHPTIAITVTSSNIGGLPKLLEWLLERALACSIHFYRNPEVGGSYARLQLEEEALIQGMRTAYAVVAQRPPRWSVLGRLLDCSDLSTRHNHACGVGEHYMVIDHNGRIAKCQMTINQAVSAIIRADPLADIRAEQQHVPYIPIDQRPACRTCEWSHWCAGGCPVATFHATGHYDRRSPNCTVYRSLYPDLLRLEGLRLLYWEQQKM